MARIIGNLKPEDDYTHACDDSPDFSESMGFNFSDRRSSLCGSLRLHNWPNRGHAELTLTLCLENGRLLTACEQAPIRDNAAFDAAGCRFEVIHPGQRLRSYYAGSTQPFGGLRLMSRASKLLRGWPRRKIALDLLHDAVGPMFAKASPCADASDSRIGYKQRTHVSGTLRIGERERTIEGSGLREHSWGVGQHDGSKPWDRLLPSACLTAVRSGSWKLSPR